MGEVTLSEKFAAAIQKDLTRIMSDIEGIKGDIVDIRGTMATKDDIREVREEIEGIKTNFATKDDLKAAVSQFAVVVSGVLDKKADRTEVRVLEARLNDLEIG